MTYCFNCLVNGLMQHFKPDGKWRAPRQKHVTPVYEQCGVSELILHVMEYSALQNQCTLYIKNIDSFLTLM